MTFPFLPAAYQSAGRLGTPVTLIVVHWMDGTLASTDVVFTSGNRQASAHYGVEDGTVHQYVREENTAWGAGDWPTNLRSINIEHSAQPGRNASDATYTTSAALIADICNRHGFAPGADTIRPHRDFTSTDCPGTLDVDRLISMAQNLSNPIGETDVVTPQDITAIAAAVEDRIFNQHMIENHVVSAPPDTFHNWAAFLEARILNHIISHTGTLNLTDAQVTSLANTLKTGLATETLAVFKAQLNK
jgi:hypothetical protein